MSRFSQSNEDQIVFHIFANIGEGGRRFIEFGCGDGRQNNTIALLHRGWSGTWFEPHKRRYLSAKERWAGWPVEIKRRVITPEKVNLVVKDPIDFLSIDVDGPDLEIWKALEATPRVVCIEAVTPDLQAFKRVGEAKGYRFHCQSASFVNAFFIKE